jgi:hypothetical protein
MEVKSRQQKSRIVTNIVGEIKRSAGIDGGGFIRKVIGYYQVRQNAIKQAHKNPRFLQ